MLQALSSRTKPLTSFPVLPTLTCLASFDANASSPHQEDARPPQGQEASDVPPLPQNVEHVDEAEEPSSSEDWVRGKSGRFKKEEKARGE
ncbi:hypothetical protein L914_19551 [Phytophthora nicotianae]|uniref:Uncharacterized protein n=1 Tax=Phytophthora nicotianae TaxID=4792 RepID=W2MC11_PHYNI|nr:hypothetical protein L914_19551 [Phytophthora nicotianae]